MFKTLKPTKLKLKFIKIMKKKPLVKKKVLVCSMLFGGSPLNTLENLFFLIFYQRT